MTISALKFGWPRTALSAASSLRPVLCVLGLAIGADRGHGQTRGADPIAPFVDSLVAARLATGQVAGMTVAVVRGEDTLVLKAYGRANVELDVPTPQQAVYEIASEGKQFTAAAILQLAEQGKLSLDDELPRHLPDFPTRGERITIRDLLHHTSGVRDFIRIPEFFAIERQSLPRDTLLKLIAAQPLDFAPATSRFYSNAGYVLLGEVIQRVSGVPYEQYVEEKLFARAGMTRTRVSHNAELAPGLVSGYVASPEGLRPGLYYDKRWPLGAGEVRSTARDMLRWVAALHGGRILGPAAYREFITPGRLRDGTPAATPDSLLGHRAFISGGSTPAGFRSGTVYLPDDRVTILVQANTHGNRADPLQIITLIVQRMLGDRTPPDLPFRGRAADYVGEYTTTAPDVKLATIATDSTGRLTLSLDGRPARRLLFHGDDTFSFGPRQYLRFVRSRGVVTTARSVTGASNVLLTRWPPASGPPPARRG